MKEFDIYLRRRLVEQDIVIWSLPFRDGLSVLYRMIPNGEILGQQLEKFLTASADLAIEARLTGTMAEALAVPEQAKVVLDAVGSFVARKPFAPQEGGLAVCLAEVPLLAFSYTDGQSGLMICTDELDAIPMKPAGHAESGLIVSSSPLELRETNVERVESAIPLTARLKEEKLSYVDAAYPLVIGVETIPLSTLSYQRAESRLCISASLVGADMDRSAGRISSRIDLSSDLDTDAEKFTAGYASATVSGNAVELTLLPDMRGESAVEVHAEMAAATGHYRILSELDGLTLAEIDNMTLEELDFVWDEDENL